MAEEEEVEECISIALVNKLQPTENPQQGDEEDQRECIKMHAPALD